MKMTKKDRNVICQWADQIKVIAGAAMMSEIDEETFEDLEIAMNYIKARFNKYKEEA